MNEYYVYNENGTRYDFIFHNLRDALEMCVEWDAEFVVSALTGEILVERG